MIEPLLEIFGVIAFENNGQLIYQSISRPQEAITLSDDIVMPETDGSAGGANTAIITTLEDYKDRTQQVTLFYQNAFNEFQPASVIKSREVGQGSHSLSLSGSIDAGQASFLVERWMRRHWDERRKISFSLPWSHAKFNVGDRVKLPVLQGGRDYLITSISDAEMRMIEAFALSQEVIPASTGMDYPSRETPQLDTKPIFQLLDLPLWPGAEIVHEQMRIACFASHWAGVSLYASASANDLQFRKYVAERSIMGELISPLEPMPSGRLCYDKYLDVQLYAGELSSCDLTRLLNGANSAAVKGSDGQWEVLQFQFAEEVTAGIWRLSNLLRGQLGTDALAEKTIPAGSSFVLLNGAVEPAGLRSSEIGSNLEWYVGAGGYPISADYFDSIIAAGGLAASRPLSPVHLRVSKNAEQDKEISWIRRGRVDADEWHYSDIPLGEAAENYKVFIKHEDRVLAEHTAAAPQILLLASDIDGWKTQGIAEIEFSVAQISERFGPGTYLTQNITL